MKADPMPPLTAAPLNRAWLRITGRDRWTSASATMVSREWTSKNMSDDSIGHWHVEYEYAVGSECYAGRFADMASNDEDYPRPGQSIEIRYNPRRPGQSYYPAQRTQTAFLVVCVVFGIIMAALTLLVSFNRVSVAR
jgi:Protein of unknown function (DUF3592)